MTQEVDQLVAQAGSRSPAGVRAAARLMSLLENAPQRLPELYRARQGAWPQPRLVLGVTGPPGAGKSTLVDRMISVYRQRHPGHRVGVIAVDPSSPFTGGALLGDRVRMMRHSTDPDVFVRSLASRGHLGGLSLGVKGVLRVLGLFGCELVLLETVGVGQSEVEVAQIADLVAVVLAPGQGDGIQMLKAGLMEAGDLFVVNKSDRDGARQLEAQLRSALKMFRGGGRRVQVPELCLTSALEASGVEELLDLLEQHTIRAGDDWRARRGESAEEDVEEAVLELIRSRVARTLDRDGTCRGWIQDVLHGNSTVPEVAERLLRQAAGLRGQGVTEDG